MTRAAGWFLLTVLTSVATVDALGIALRARPSGRAELAMVWVAAWFALIASPVLVLGYADVLTPASLAFASTALFGAVFLLLARGQGARALLGDCYRAALSVASMPLDALREAARARSIVLVGLVVTGAILAASVFLTIFAPNENWDGFLYHEPIVGFALQNHGFSMVPLQMHGAVQATNGYPRLCEAVSLWFVAFTDKTLIELPNEIGAPALMFATYALARRFGDRLTAMGWACVLLLMPQVWSQLCQTLIDIDVAFFALVAVYYATRPVFRVGDAWCAILGMALLVSSKASGILVMPPLALLAGVRLVRSTSGSGRVAALATLSLGGVLLAGLGLLATVRNLRAFHNPLWPITFESRTLGIHWDGLIPVNDLGNDKPLVELALQAFDVPIGGMGDVIQRGYGYAIAWVVIPLGVVALLLGLALATVGVFRPWHRGVTKNLPLLLLALLAGILFTPTVNGRSARYNTYLVGGLMAAVTWLLSARRWARAREAVLGAAVVLSILPLFWMRGRGWYWASTEHPEDIVLHPFDSRRGLARPSFDLLARARNEELMPGDRVVFDQDVAFVGALWNFEFSNRIEYLKYDSSGQFIAEAESRSPTWIAVGKEGDARKAVERTGRWELVGSIHPGGDVVFRRKRG